MKEIKIKNLKKKILTSNFQHLTTSKGITLIALVITIIVMLILVAVTISMAINGGLFNYAGKAVGVTKNTIANEQELFNEIKNYIENPTNDVKDDSEKEDDILREIKLDKKTIHLEENESVTLTATLTNLEGPIQWETTNASIVSISSEEETTITITGGNVGTAKVTCRCGEFSDSCSISVGSFSQSFSIGSDGERPTGVTRVGDGPVMDFER